jgi:aryl-alcohol dehydrogenase-like predicted oxidoreductase
MDDGGRYDFHLEMGMPLVAYQSQAYGLFQRLHHGTLDQMRPHFLNLYRLPETMARYERMRSVMASTGYNISQVVLGYLMSQPFLTIPIVGCQRPEQVWDSLSAAHVRLTPDQLRFIDRGAPVVEEVNR